MLGLRRGMLGCLVALLAACGGGEDDSADTSRSAATVAERSKALAAAPFFPSMPISAEASREGMWSPVYSWPLYPVHAVLMPDGRVLTFSISADSVDVWEGVGSPEKGHATVPNPTGTNLFCSALQLLPKDGTVLMAGGDVFPQANTGNIRSSLFTGGKNPEVTRGNDMNRIRWYASAITLVNGETYIQGGTGGEDHPEVRGLDGQFRLLTGADTSTVSYDYPRNFVVPDGRVFGIGTDSQLYYVDPTGDGSFNRVGDTYNFNTYWGGSSAAMFEPGKILQFGGSSNAAIVVDVSAGGMPVVKATNSMSSRRHFVNASILPDGRVLGRG